MGPLVDGAPGQPELLATGYSCRSQVDRLRGIVAASLGWSLRHRWVVVAIATVAILSSFTLFGKLGSAFMPKADPGQFQVNYKASPSVSLERSIEIARQIDSEVRSNPGVAYTYTTIGGTGGQPINEGAIFVKLKQRELRPHYSLIQAAMRRTTSSSMPL